MRYRLDTFFRTRPYMHCSGSETSSIVDVYNVSSNIVKQRSVPKYKDKDSVLQTEHFVMRLIQENQISATVYSYSPSSVAIMFYRLDIVCYTSQSLLK